MYSELKMNRDNYVEKYGGKAGLHKFLRDTGRFNSHLLPTAYVPPGQSPERVLNSMNWDFDGRNILRSSNKSDLEGLVDVLQTVTGIEDMEELVSDAREIRKHAKSKRVMNYAKSEDPTYDGKTTLMIQPELDVTGELELHTGEIIRGSIVEHPNKKGTYMLSFVRKTLGPDKHKSVIATDEEFAKDEELRNDDGWSPESLYLIAGKKVVNLYKRVCDELGYNGMSIQMEFGINYFFPELDEIIFHQARFFKPFESPRFELSTMDDSYVVFGQTNEEGVVLEVVRTSSIEETPEHDKPFIWIPDEIIQGHELGLTPVSENMKAFATEENYTFNVKSLEHNLFRFVQKAEVSIIELPWSLELQNGQRIRLFANGVGYHIDRNI